MNKYYENTVCDRLAEAVEHADKRAKVAHILMDLTPLGIGIRMKRGLFSNYQVVSYLDLSEAKINVLPLHIDKMCEELVNKEKAS